MERICAKCSTQFEITEKHLNFYRKVSPVFCGTVCEVPPPTFCPDCRQQRRMAWRSEKHLFVRTCSKTGNRMVSMYQPTTIYPVYKGRDWWKDENEALGFGREADLSRSVFEQLRELQCEVPRMQMFTYALDRLVNSEYVNCCGDSKDCYMIFCSGRNERGYYSTALMDSYECMDTYFVRDSTNCYECIDVDHGDSLWFAQSCKECHDSAFLYDCRGCSNCICCAGLRHKEYYVFNKPCSKEEFAEKKAQLLSNSRKHLEETDAKFREFLKSVPRRFMHGTNNENSTGDFLSTSKNSEHCFDTYNVEDCDFCTWFVDGKDCMDFFSWGESELSYEISGGGDGAYHNLFCAMSCGLRSCLYCDHCQYCSDCFACVGLKRKNYCIMNKQYSKGDYEALVVKLIEQMIARREWGEFFPAHHSPFGYNHTVAAEDYPLSKETALREGFLWSDYEPPAPDVKRVLKPLEIPDRIAEVDDTILDCALTCELSGRPFRIAKEELAFYRKNSIPLPRRDSLQRHADRAALRNPRKLWQRRCDKCRKELMTSFSPERSEKVYCETCYNEYIY